MARIIACDDEIQILEVLKQFLMMSGHTVEVTTDSTTVMAMLERRPCDLVILDYHMEKLDGRALLAEIRKKYSPVEVPVAFLSGEKEKSFLQDIAKLGISAFFLKPPNFSALAERLKTILAYRLETTDVRSMLLSCNIPDKELYKAPGLTAFKERKMPLFEVSFKGRVHVVAQIGNVQPQTIAQGHGPALIRECRIMSLFGSTWFRVWPTSWMIAAAKRSASPLPVVVPKKEMDAIFDMVNKALEA